MEKLSRKYFDDGRDETVDIHDKINRHELLEQTKSLFNYLDEAQKEGLVYTVVGGVSLYAYTNTEYEPIRTNGTSRDIDIIVFEDPTDYVKKFKEDSVKQNKENQDVLRVDFNYVKDEQYHSSTQLLSHLKRNNDGYALVFRDIEMKISENLLTPCRASLNIDGEKDVSFSTLEPGTLLHLYLQRMGSLKIKDKKKLQNFLRECDSLRFSATNAEEHKKYTVFHDFAREIREQYPYYSFAIKTYSTIDYTIFNSLFSNKIIPKRIFQMLIDS